MFIANCRLPIANCKRNISRFALVILGLIIFLPSFASAGSLDAPASPTDTASAMFTLENIYNLIGSGTTPATRTTFVEPSAAPGSTGHTLTEVKELLDLRAHATCNGTLNGTRWCDNGNGTVTDLTTGLIWLKDANWGGDVAFFLPDVGSTTAHDRAASLTPASNEDLSDGSVEGDWRLPTLKELKQLTTDPERVRSDTPLAFTNVQNNWYWSSTTDVSSTADAWIVLLSNGVVSIDGKSFTHFVWPVRGGQ